MVQLAVNQLVVVQVGHEGFGVGVRVGVGVGVDLESLTYQRVPIHDTVSPLVGGGVNDGYTTP